MNPDTPIPPPLKPRPTMEDVAERAGVSRSLVSLVMRDSPKVSDTSRQAVLQAADELGYQANLIASNLASQRTYTIGVVLNDLHNLYFVDVYDGIVDTADAAGYRLVMNGGRNKPEAEAKAIANFVSLRVEGIVVAGAEINDADIDALVAPSQTPVVVVGRHAEGPLIDSIHIDDPIGAQLAVSHLVELGHRRIAHIDGGNGAGAAERRASYGATMNAFGLGAEVSIVAGHFTEAGGYHGAERLMTGDHPPTAIFAANDIAAIGALDWLLAHDYDVPGDVSIVGYDNISLAAMRHISLTTIDQPRREMGTQALQLLFERTEGRTEPRRYVAEPGLTIRATTGPPSPTKDTP